MRTRHSIGCAGLACLAASLLAGCATEKHVYLVRTVVLAEGMPSDRAAGTFCEGTYDCVTDGSVFTIGTRTRIGFFGRENCPADTTLEDGSSWRLVPGSCRCD